MTEPDETTHTMPARDWGDGGPAPKAEPVVEVSSRDGADVPDVPAVTRLHKTATEAGWDAWTTYARAEVPGHPRKPAHTKHTVCLRLARGNERGYALWYREDRLKFDAERGVDGVEVGTWKFGDAMIAGRSCGARDLPARLRPYDPIADVQAARVRAATEDVPGALSADAPTPDGGKAGGAMITGSSSPGIPVPPPPPVTPGTWGSLHPGDVVTANNGQPYTVATVEVGGYWAGSRTHEVRVLMHGPNGEPVTVHRPVTERVPIFARGEVAQVAAVAWEAGLRIEPVKEIVVQPDQFSAPAPAPAHMTRMEPPTGQYGWYKLPDPAGQTGPGIYPRVTTIVKTMANDGGLTDWKIAQVVRGLAKRPDLIAMAASLDPERDKGKMREVIEQADAAAGSKSGANLGTAIDRFTERLDAGESIASMAVPDNLRPVVEAYATTLARYGLTVLPEYTQRTVLNTTHAYAGTWDRLVVDQRGRVRVLDVKTNKLDAKTGQLPDYHWFEWGQQQAFYNHAEHMCSLDFAGYDPMPHIDQSMALILHIPINGAPDVYEVDTIKAWAVARGSVKARGWRTESRSGWARKLDPPPTGVPAGGLDYLTVGVHAAQVAAAQPSALVAVTTEQLAQVAHDPVRAALDLAVDTDALIEVSRLAREAGVWTPAHEAHALVRYDLLRAASAADQAALAALWAELQPLGRWTGEVDAAAAQRMQQFATVNA